MKKPVVDYRQFRLRKLNSPEFSHLKLLGGWLIYFALYFLTENLIPRESCYPVHCILDDWIPFREEFVIPYVLWYGLIVVSLVWFALYNIQGFKQLSTYIFITQMVAMAIYILFPNRQDLRPEVLPRENFLTDIVSLLYTLDTSTNVCPSLHVAYSLGIASVWLREKQAWKWWKAFVVVLVALVCLSVAFVKQHSVLDIFAAIPLCALAEWLVFWRKKKA
ncbi:MAG: phosphatase PAP2 family protein [Oscillospiraceae bacterium]|nr:phosphatase PAP2 family protein [Oscillospiraceae bacterium]